MEKLQFVFPNEESRPMPLPKQCHGNVAIKIQQGHEVLTVYEKVLQGVGSHYAGVNYKESGIQYCIARPFEKADEARRIYGLLIRCKHPNVLHPLGLWISDPKVKWGKKGDGQIADENQKAEIVEECHSKSDGDKREEMKKVIEAFITFPLIDGSLIDVPREDIFLVEKDGKQPTIYGFTCEGSKIFCDILGVVEHINGMYEQVVNMPSGESSSCTKGPSLPLCAVKSNPGRIVYNKLADGQYKVLLWLDFFTEDQERKKYKRAPTAIDIWSANWDTITTFLKSLWKRFHVQPNEELKQLVSMLSRKLLKGEETVRYNNLLWEPGLWTVYIKIRFIREVFWCFDGNKEREDLLKSKTSLGLQSVIASLGFSNADNNLYDSIMFLRKKIVAHQDSSYLTYSGKKDDVGTDKTTIEIFVQKIDPKYMIKLVKEIRPLNWIEMSPLLRSETTYMEPFKVK